MEEKISKDELLEEVKVALQDEFVAEMKKDAEGLVLRFANGQAFRLTIEEV